MYTRKICQFDDEDGATIKITAVNARALRIKGSSKPIIEREDKTGNILSVTFVNHTFKIGGVVNFKSTPYNLLYKITEITEGSHVGRYYEYIFHNDVLNYSAIFLLPMLGGHNSDYLFDTNFINSYVFSEYHDDDPKLYLYYRFTGDRRYNKFEEMFTNHKYCELLEDVDKQTVLFSFSIPDRHLDDWNYFINSKYSLLSKELKSKILKFYSYNNNSVIYHVLNKTDKRKKALENEYDIKLDDTAELWEAVKEDKETFRSELILKEEDYEWLSKTDKLSNFKEMA